MKQRTWLITGVSRGFGRQLTEQLLNRGDRVIGTVRDTKKITDLVERYPQTFHAEVLEMTDPAAIRAVVERTFARRGRIDVLISNAGYGLFGVAEELTDGQVVYDQTPAHSFLRMLDPKNGLAPGDPARMAARIIESVDVAPAPLRMALGSQALEGTLATLRKRLANFETQTALAASTDFPPGA